MGEFINNINIFIEYVLFFYIFFKRDFRKHTRYSAVITYGSEYIVDNYNVVPIAHIQLLNGQTKHSDAGQTIENDYYIFEATNKANGKKEIIQCGMTAARDFLKKINHEGLPLFNPLHGEGGTGNVVIESKF